MIRPTLPTFFALLLVTPAAANDDTTVYVMPEIPTEQEKIDVLKMAYQINGRSMVRPLGQGSIDLSGPTTFSIPKSDRIIPLTKKGK